MALSVDDSAPEWIFSTPENGSMSRHAAGWHQLANDPLADTSVYWNGTALWTSSPNASATLIFQGVEIYLVSAKMPQGGQMNVTCDWDSEIIDLGSSVHQVPVQVWHATNLSSTAVHALKVQLVGEGKINIDSVQINPGPPSAFPPSMPSPLPHAFPKSLAVSSTLSVTMTSTMTRTMTMTMTASSGPDPNSSDISLSRGAAAGIAVGLIAASFLIAFLFMCCKRGRNRSGKSRNRYQGMRRLGLPGWIGGKGYLSPGGSAPSFMNEDREKAGEEVEERVGNVVPSAFSRFLPSIRRPSTLSLGQFSVSTPSGSILAQFPPPPRASFSPPPSHTRQRSHAVTLSIDTDVGTIKKSGYVGASGTLRTGSLSRSQTSHSIAAHRQTSGGFSTSDLTEAWHEVSYERDISSLRGETDDAIFYAEHFSSGSVQEYTEPQDDATYIDEPDDISPDTPLLARSPAIASSNVSLTYHSSDRSHASRFSKGNKILRSLHSYSSKRSSLRRSLGKPSRRSSYARTPDTRTPVSKNSMSTNSSNSPRSERHATRQSTMSMFSVRVPVVITDEPTSPSGTAPLVPTVPEDAPLSFLVPPPSSWNNAQSSRDASTKLQRIHRPIGPRTRERSISNSSTNTISSSGGSTRHSQESSRAERVDMLSVVEEGSRSGSPSRTSSERFTM